MIKEVTGDLLTARADIIAHQTNYVGVMGGGVAAAIRKKMLDDVEYLKYTLLCNEMGPRCLGMVQFLQSKKGRLIANCFSQDEFPSNGDSFTSLRALKRCAEALRTEAATYGYTVAIPWHYGCGIAGGNWDEVREVFDQYFGGKHDPTLLIVCRPEDMVHEVGRR